MDNWQEKFALKCREHSIEPVIQDNELLLICPKVPDKSLQSEITEGIPAGVSYRFQEGPRMSTIEGLKALLIRAGAKSVSLEVMNHNLLIKVNSQSPALTEDESDIWPVFSDMLGSDPFVVSWKIQVNDKVMSEFDRSIAEIVNRQTRPKRDIGITKDDLLNLQITLGACETVEDFINSI